MSICREKPTKQDRNDNTIPSYHLYILDIVTFFAILSSKWLMQNSLPGLMYQSYPFQYTGGEG